MHRFHHPALEGVAVGEVTELDRDEARHASRVLRLDTGTEVELFDGAGTVAAGVIARVRPGSSVAVRVNEVWREEMSRPLIDVAAPVPKGARAEAMVRQLSEVGAAQWVPLLSRYTVVSPRPAKVARLGKVAVEAAKQCGRSHVLQIDSPRDLETVLDGPHDLRILGQPPGRDPASPSTDIAERLRAADRVLILIGPEGGWAPHETRLAMDRGSITWSFGPFVQRLETAAVTAAAIAACLAAPGADRAPADR